MEEKRRGILSGRSIENKGYFVAFLLDPRFGLASPQRSTVTEDGEHFRPSSIKELE